EVIERDLQPLEEVPPRFGLPQLEFGAAPDDFAPELDEVIDQLDERQHFRTPADDRQHDDAETALERRVLVEIVEDGVRDFAALQIDDDGEAVAVRFVANV